MQRKKCEDFVWVSVCCSNTPSLWHCINMEVRKNVYTYMWKSLETYLFLNKSLDCKRTKKYINFIVIVVDSDLWLGWGYNPLERGPGDTLWLHRSCLQSYAGRIGHVVLFTQSLEKKKRWAKKGVQFENKVLGIFKKEGKGCQLPQPTCSWKWVG